MALDLESSIRETVHDLINLHLFPEYRLQLGQFDHCCFCGAEVVWERTGNLYSYGHNAITYRYNIDGPGFALRVLAIWTKDDATADIEVLAIYPDNEVIRETLRDWLTRAATGSWAAHDRLNSLCLSCIHAPATSR